MTSALKMSCPLSLPSQILPKLHIIQVPARHARHTSLLLQRHHRRTPRPPPLRHSTIHSRNTLLAHLTLGPLLPLLAPKRDYSKMNHLTPLVPNVKQRLGCPSEKLPKDPMSAHPRTRPPRPVGARLFPPFVLDKHPCKFPDISNDKCTNRPPCRSPRSATHTQMHPRIPCSRPHPLPLTLIVVFRSKLPLTSVVASYSRKFGRIRATPDFESTACTARGTPQALNTLR